jgi:alanyl aminopeptidase
LVTSKWQRFFALLAFIGVCIFCFVVISNVQHERNLTEKRSSPQGRLPDTVVPLSYDLKLRIDPDNVEFSGVVKIQLKIKMAVKEIWLHGKNIIPTKVILNSKDGSQPLIYKEMGHSGVVRLTAQDTLLPQKTELEIHYNTAFDTKLNGLYKVEESGLNYIFSQFEAIGARKAFPGFDEPRFKVPFELSMEVKEHHKGFTNTPQISQQDLPDGFKRLTFATTKPLPTYLLAFVVGDLDVVEHEPIPSSDIRSAQVPLRGITVKGKGGQLAYALNNTGSLLTKLEDYFGMPYPYAKLDLIAVPDFGASGMENAGLIAYREQFLLLGDSPSYAQQRRFASIHAHELAHQWFGNLVTMRWWDDLWLNESFATWMANKVVNQWQPHLEFERGLIRSGHRVMVDDALVNARQVREPVPNNDVIENAFDRITYQKGGAVLQMFERFIGAEVFRKGVQFHLQRFAYGHADASDFIRSIEKISGKAGLKDAFFSFLTQPGVPKVEVQWRCDNNKTQLQVKQSRYLPLGTTGSSEQLWQLPVCFNLIGSSPLGSLVGTQSPPLCTIISEAQQSIEVNGSCPVAVMPNSEANGYYRFSYNQAQWQALLQQLHRLSSAEKYSVANNLAAAFRAGDVDASFYINSIKPFTHEQDWDLITTPINDLQFIADYIASPKEREQLMAYLDVLYRPLLHRLGLRADTQDDETSPVATSLLRRNIIAFMALRIKEPQLRSELLTLAKRYIGFNGDNRLNESVLNPDLVATAFVVAVEELGEVFFTALKNQIKASSDSTFRQRGLYALGAAVEPELAEEVRSMVLSLSIKNNERAYLVRSQLRNVENHPAVYEWLKTYFSVMSTALPESVLAYTPTVANGFCSKAKADDVEAFFSEKTADIAGAQRHLALVLERINICIAIKNNQQGLHFADNGGL